MVYLMVIRIGSKHHSQSSFLQMMAQILLTEVGQFQHSARCFEGDMKPDTEKNGVAILLAIFTGTISGVLSGFFIYCLPDNRTASYPSRETPGLGKKSPSICVPAPQVIPVKLTSQPIENQFTHAVPEIAYVDKNKDDVVARERDAAAEERSRAEREQQIADRERARADSERERAEKESLLKEAAIRALAEETRKRERAEKESLLKEATIRALAKDSQIRRLEDQIQMEKEDKEAEEAVASRKLKFAKQLRTASFIEENKGNVRESQRLLGCYITELDLIIETYPKTKSAEEARMMYGYGDTASNSR